MFNQMNQFLLFQSEDSPSPYLEFINKHQIKTERYNEGGIDEIDYRWRAWFGNVTLDEFLEDLHCSTGDTEKDAIFNLARIYCLDGFNQFDWG